jgi:hypothetical protein
VAQASGEKKLNEETPPKISPNDPIFENQKKKKEKNTFFPIFYLPVTTVVGTRLEP